MLGLQCSEVCVGISNVAQDIAGIWEFGASKMFNDDPADARSNVTKSLNECTKLHKQKL